MGCVDGRASSSSAGLDDAVLTCGSHAARHALRCPGLCPVCRRPPSFTAVRAPSLTCPVNPHGRPRTVTRTVGKRVGGNPSRVRISYPPPVPHRALTSKGPTVRSGALRVVRFGFRPGGLFPECLDHGVRNAGVSRPRRDATARRAGGGPAARAEVGVRRPRPRPERPLRDCHVRGRCRRPVFEPSRTQVCLRTSSANRTGVSCP